MTETANIEVYCDNTDGEQDMFAVVSEHRPDLPKPFESQLQEWVQENFDHLEVGDSLPEAAKMEYEPNEDIVEFRRK
ncbi:hypothetical protein [Halorussus ruber]|uniref:hypothetical protein n=1 Tax=Halorussus ruber TaxID=1126238 RepID=UPI001092EAC8|nr:hypothetical protein [Halorussus ruber]